MTILPPLLAIDRAAFTRTRIPIEARKVTLPKSTITFLWLPAITLNGISIYTVAKNSPDPALKAIAADMDHANMPIGPVGKPTEQQNILNTYAYTYTKYPNAVREYLVSHGVSAERITTISFGKEQPIDPGEGDEAWQKNRNGKTAIVGGSN